MSYKISNLETPLQVGRATDADKIYKLEETVEFLLEQIESLKLYLFHKNYELQQIEQELDYTKQELCDALSSKQLTINEAMELAKNFLVLEFRLKASDSPNNAYKITCRKKYTCQENDAIALVAQSISGVIAVSSAPLGLPPVVAKR